MVNNVVCCSCRSLIQSLVMANYFCNISMGALAVGLQLFELTCGTKVGLYCCFNLHVTKLIYDTVAELMTSQN
jgi:hypothetical protein